MISIQSEIYIYAFFVILFSSVIALVSITFLIRKSEIPILSTNLFQLYFIFSLLGWAALAYIEINQIPFDLTLPVISYFISVFILFFAIIESTRTLKFILIFGAAHITIIIICILLPDAASRLQLLSVYIICITPFMVFILFKRAKKFNNIGHAILGAAPLFVFIGAPIQLYALHDLNDFNLAYGITVVTAATANILVGIGFLTTIFIIEHQYLSSLALRDPLTSLLNRRGLDFAAQAFLGSAKRNKYDMSIIAIDIDYFKKVNDTYGHDGGDAVLIHISKILQICIRTSDICCRLGGEEFVVILPETNHKDSMMIAERIRRFLKNISISYNEYNISVTASFGVASENTDIDLEKMIKEADEALYSAKADGRNCVRTLDKS